MNEKHEFQVGDLVRLKSVEEILALGFWFNELGGISYPNKKEIMLLSNELKYCGKEYVVKDVVDTTAHNHITLDSPNSSVRIVNVCPSVLELVEVEEEETTFKSGDRVRIKQVDELLELGYTIDAYGDLRYPNNCVFLNKYQMQYCGQEFTVVDHEVAGIYVIESLDRETLFDFVLESAMELIEDEDEDWISKPDLKVKPGDKVRIKTHEELIETGWTFYGDNYLHSIDDEAIVSGMHKFLGEVYAVEKIVEGNIKLEEDYEYWNWTSYMIAEVIEENTYENQLPALKVGDRVRIKTHEELLASGWVFNGEDYFRKGFECLNDVELVSCMTEFLGGVYKIKTIFEEDEDVAGFYLEGDTYEWYWTSHMVAEVITDEEVTYRDEDGNPFDPQSDYIEEEEYQPYCAVVDDTPVSNNTYEPTTWDKDRIQRGFENLEMYIKGYDDGFQRALELMKKEFGVE